MKRLRALADSNEWFNGLTRKQQQDYIKQHPHTKLKVNKTDTAPTKKPAIAPTAPLKKLTPKPADVPSSKPRVLHETKVVDGKRVMADGSPLPEYVAKLRVPPAWTDVRISPDPEADLLVTGRDQKGRLQPIYSAKFAATQAQAKFERVAALAGAFDSVFAANEKARSSKNPKERDAADCMRLIMQTGIRPGSEADTGAEKQAYGASTLLGQHVKINKGKVVLQFTGKKGVSLAIPVDDPKTAKMLTQRAQQAGAEGKLFPALSTQRLQEYTQKLGGGEFKTKDFRTHVGTSTAMEEISKGKAPTNEKEYRAAVMAVAKTVSTKLGNTPVIALQSYINPVVFSEWRSNLGMTGDEVLPKAPPKKRKPHLEEE